MPAAFQLWKHHLLHSQVFMKKETGWAFLLTVLPIFIISFYPLVYMENLNSFSWKWSPLDPIHMFSEPSIFVSKGKIDGRKEEKGETMKGDWLSASKY